MTVTTIKVNPAVAVRQEVFGNSTRTAAAFLANLGEAVKIRAFL
jgi:hypothetical protein